MGDFEPLPMSDGEHVYYTVQFARNQVEIIDSLAATMGLDTNTSIVLAVLAGLDHPMEMMGYAWLLGQAIGQTEPDDTERSG